ncbi:E1 ubiquitin-activating protein uba2 [Dimargaris verticillata]|uniref:E1 ubiquitin-activating protein uba2 n=1 Tax=Dimargaris verticillata TaxID=2761393 RepID=A0A9W8B028_9FUNG|nr:E1 ubiquitin-activating protein uba2 [Dimargaris verticillata]
MPLTLATTAELVPDTTRVLVVGAGGIGCELLKNLVLSGFLRIDVVDLDTIDLSNLNRQFLFQKQHISQPKATVAAQAVQRFNPQASVVAHHANIKDPQYDAAWFAQFDLVLNALDNLDARRHVNRMCLLTNRPLVESGTAGYLGQVTVIRQGFTECFDCQPKPTPKTFPICTIRSTPSAPIHCIVWAKDYLFTQMFAAKAEDDDDDAIAAPSASDDPAEIQLLHLEASALKQLQTLASPETLGPTVFTKVFTEDIARLLTMDEMWANKPKPEPLDLATLYRQALDQDYVDHAVLEPPAFHTPAWSDQQVWSVAQNLHAFLYSTSILARRCHALTQANTEADLAPTVGLTFDKDDDDCLTFVTAAANLRAQVFHIDAKSRFDVKAMAGNIIPAIATTNAIVAGLMVIQATHLATGHPDRCQTTYLAKGTNRPRLFYNEQLATPSTQCVVCQRRYVTMHTNLECATLRDLLTALKPYRHALGLGDDLVIEEGGRLLYDPDFDDNLDRPLANVGICQHTFVTVAAEEPDPWHWPLSLYIIGSTDQPMPVAIKEPEQLAMPLHVKQPLESQKRKAEDQLSPDTTKIARADQPLVPTNGISSAMAGTADDSGPHTLTKPLENLMTQPADSHPVEIPSDNDDDTVTILD